LSSDNSKGQKKRTPSKKGATKRKSGMTPRRKSAKRAGRPGQKSKKAEPLDQVLDVWLQQAKETNVAYKAFAVYRDFQTHERTLAKTAAFLEKDVSLMEKWSARWSWVMRAREWDIEKERSLLVANLSEIFEMRTAQALTASIIQRAALVPSIAIVRLLDADPDALINGLKDEKGNIVHSRLIELFHIAMAGARIIPAVADVERLARGEPTQITDHRVTDSRILGDEIFKNPETRRKALELQEEMFGILNLPKVQISNGKKKE
jgi:hypothetical protein